MRKNEPKAYKSLNRIIKLTLGVYLRHVFNIRYEGQDKLKTLKPPYLILGNHTNFWDPFMMGLEIPAPVYYVTSDEFFRKAPLRLLLKLVGAIPKTKAVSDSETVKNILKVRNKNGIIGIYPEGKRNWDGKTLEILFPTAKLVKTLKIPVVVGIGHGAYLSQPRWANNIRKGVLTIKYEIILSAEAVEALSVEEIYAKLCEALAHDEYAIQEKRMLPYKGRKLAEHLELFLFACPHCQEIGTLKSSDDRFFCTKCGYQVRYNEYGFFEKYSEQLYFTNPRDWNLWQLDFFTDKISSHTDDSTPIITDKQVLLLHGQRLSPLQEVGLGELNLYPDKLQFISLQGEKINFPIEEISGVNIQYNDVFEFYHDKTLYRFIFKIQYTSAYKWKHAWKILKKEN